MSWQEELRNLDAALAAGKISRQEHRKQRDELLAAASGGAVPSPVVAPLGNRSSTLSWQSTNPGSPAAVTPQPTDAGETAHDSQPSQQPNQPQQSNQAQQPDQPTAQQPDQPTAQQPGQPAAQQPDQPTAQQPGQPTSQQPGQPAPQQPGQPAPQQPGQPTAQQPDQPTAQQPGQPAPQQPGQPAAQQPGQPTSQQPGQPEGTTKAATGEQSQPTDADKSTTDKPATDKPATDKPAHTDKAADADKPTDANKPGDAKPGDAGKPGPSASPAVAGLLGANLRTSAPSPADDRPTDTFHFPGMSEAPTVITRAVAQDEPPSADSGAVPRQTDDVPAFSKPRGRGPTWLILSVGVLVVLALIVGATFFFGTKQDTGNTATPRSSVVNPPLDVEGKLPTLPGTPNPNNSTMSVDKAAQAQIISSTDLSKVRASGAQEIVYRASSDEQGGYMLLAIPASSPEDAAKLVKGLRETLMNAGFRTDPLGQSEDEIAYTGSNSTGRVTALWYASGPVVVGIGVSQPLDGNPAALHTRMVQVHDQVVAALPGQ